MLPQAYVSPAQMRATRDLLRRRTPLMRKCSELLAHVHNPNSQYNLPESGKKIASKANREGVAERCADPAVQKSIEVDLALITSYDQLLSDVELSIVKAAKHQVEEACITAILLEKAAGMQLLARQYGAIEWTPDAEALQKQGRIYHPEAFQQM